MYRFRQSDRVLLREPSRAAENIGCGIEGDGARSCLVLPYIGDGRVPLSGRGTLCRSPVMERPWVWGLIRSPDFFGIGASCQYFPARTLRSLSRGRHHGKRRLCTLPTGGYSAARVRKRDEAGERAPNQVDRLRASPAAARGNEFRGVGKRMLEFAFRYGREPCTINGHLRLQHGRARMPRLPISSPSYRSPLQS